MWVTLTLFSHANCHTGSEVSFCTQQQLLKGSLCSNQKLLVSFCVFQPTLQFWYRVCFLLNSQHLALLPPLLLAFLSPMGVLVRQKSRNSGSKVDTWDLNGQTELVKCKISGPSCSLWRRGIAHLSAKGLFFNLVIDSFIRIQKLHISCVALRSHSQIYLNRQKLQWVLVLSNYLKLRLTRETN